MAWFKVDDSFGTSPKVMTIPRRIRMQCLGLWVTAGTWSAQHLTDGRIPDHMIEEWGAEVSHGDALVASGLWERDTESYVFHDWADYQPTRVDTLANREKERRRKEDWRLRNRENTGQSPAGTHSREDNPSEHPDPTRPDPTRPLKEASLPGEAKRKETRLPKDWAPTAEHIKRAKEKNLDLADEVENFRLHAETHDRHAASWNGAFTTWLKKAKPRNVTPMKRGIPQNDEWMYR